MKRIIAICMTLVLTLCVAIPSANARWSLLQHVYCGISRSGDSIAPWIELFGGNGTTKIQVESIYVERYISANNYQFVVQWSGQADMKANGSYLFVSKNSQQPSAQYKVTFTVLLTSPGTSERLVFETETYA